MLWVEFLDRALDPAGHGVASLWRDLGAHSLPADAALQDWNRDLGLLHAAAVDRILGAARQAPPEVRQWLGAVTLRIEPPGRHAGFDWPALRARRQAASLPGPVEEALSTALVDLLAGPDSSSVVRCGGVVRVWTAGWPYSASEDTEFARRAGLAGLLEADQRQCPRLVASPRHGRYCSKACSNAGFALRKAAREPRYFARKQERYRIRQRRQTAAAARVDGAFSFVD